MCFMLNAVMETRITLTGKDLRTSHIPNLALRSHLRTPALIWPEKLLQHSRLDISRSKTTIRHLQPIYFHGLTNYSNLLTPTVVNIPILFQMPLAFTIRTAMKMSSFGPRLGSRGQLKILSTWPKLKNYTKALPKSKVSIAKLGMKRALVPICYSPNSLEKVHT